MLDQCSGRILVLVQDCLMHHIPLFAGRAAGTNANILFDSASHNYVFTKLAKLIGISISPSLQKVRLSSVQKVSSDGEAPVYIRVGGCFPQAS